MGGKAKSSAEAKSPFSARISMRTPPRLEVTPPHRNRNKAEPTVQQAARNPVWPVCHTAPPTPGVVNRKEYLGDRMESHSRAVLEH